MKDAPSAKEHADVATMRTEIDELKKGYNKLNDWLGGTVDPWTGKPRHDGFIETFPQYQDEIRTTLGTILSRIEGLNGGTH